MSEVILEIKNLKKYFMLKNKLLNKSKTYTKAIDGIDIQIDKMDILGIVGESGSGKTTLAKTILGVYRPTEGEIYFKKIEISNLPIHRRKFVQKEIQYVYQNPGSSFDPWWVVGKSLEEPLKIHTKLTINERVKKVHYTLTSVGLDKNHAFRYPHEFSGGQQRRLALARVLVLNPSLIIFDEPTSGLDVSIQATILKLLKNLRDLFGLTYIFISHDLEVVRMMSNKICVLYLGKVVEFGPTETIFIEPKHPYTKLLLASAPRIYDQEEKIDQTIIKEVNEKLNISKGCLFEPRCQIAQTYCRENEPLLKRVSDGRKCACHLLSNSNLY